MSSSLLTEELSSLDTNRRILTKSIFDGVLSSSPDSSDLTKAILVRSIFASVLSSIERSPQENVMVDETSEMSEVPKVSYVSETARRVETEKKVFTYFVQGQNTRNIKIGKSRNVGDRFCALQTASGEPLKLLFTIPDNVEKELHRKFYKHRLHGEWFMPSQPILDFIEEQKSLQTAPTPS